MYKFINLGSGSGSSGGAGNTNSCCYPLTITDVNEDIINVDQDTNIIVLGNFLTPDVTVTCPTATIFNIQFISTTEIRFIIQTMTEQTNTVTIANAQGSVDFNIVSDIPSWVDLRENSGDAFTEVHSATGTVSRGANGLTLNDTIWRSFIQFPSHMWNRADKKKVSIIIKQAGNSHMVGIAADDYQNKSDSSQYYQHEIVAYVPSDYLYGVYGHDSSGGGVNQSNSGGTSFAGKPYYKIVFENNGEPNSVIRCYALDDLSDFNDESDLRESFTISGDMTANGNDLMVSCIVTNANTVVAFKVENM